MALVATVNVRPAPLANIVTVTVATSASGVDPHQQVIAQPTRTRFTKIEIQIDCIKEIIFMKVGVRIFNNFKEANNYAKSIVLSVRKSPLVKPAGDKFEVYGEGVTAVSEESLADLKQAKIQLDETRTLLENSTQESLVKTVVSDYLAKYGNLKNFAETLANAEDLTLYEKLEDIHSALDEFIEIIDEANPRSSDEADYYSKRCIAISNQLKPYKVAARAQKEAREFSEKVKKLPTVVAGQNNWLHKVSILNANGPICRLCSHLARMHIVGERGYEVWKCSANNHGTRFLTGEQRRFLAD